jgi:uncharacterized membrane protein
MARSADVVNADVQLRLARDASLLVTETLTFDYDGSFKASYRDIPVLSGEEITDISVSENGRLYERGGCTIEGCSSPRGTFGTTGLGVTSTRIVWHHKGSDESRTFDLSYRVVSSGASAAPVDGVYPGATVAYNDVIDVAWTVWGDQWDFGLANLTASFTNPRLDPENNLYRVWGHPRDVEGETSRDLGVARLSANDVNSGQFVEMRVTVPRDPNENVSGARQVPEDGLPAILAFEEGLDEDFNAPWPTFKRWVADNAAIVCGALAALALLVLALMWWLARERKVSVPTYLSGPPEEGVSPALAYALAHEGRDSSNTVLATLLDLTDRGYYVASQASTEDEKQDIAIGKSPQRPTEDANLQAYEREVMEFFDDVVDGYSVPMSEMSDRIPKHSATWRARWQAMTSALDNAEEGHLTWDRNLNPARFILLFVMAGLFAGVALITSAVDETILLPLAIGIPTLLVILIFPGSALRRLREGERERSAQWAAFANWTEDFPRLKDDPPETLALWKRILVYGVAFGTADRMIKSGRIPAPVGEAASSDGSWTSYAFTGAFVGSSFDGGDFSSGFASQVAPESSSSGGGGGFSGGGGGGGFSGGGGGGSW